MFQFQTFNCPLLAKKLCICGMRIFLNFDPTILLDAPLNLLFHIQTGRNCIVQNCGGNCKMVVVLLADFFNGLYATAAYDDEDYILEFLGRG